jgi:4-amino-4-deoxy-L-arabinose transferase-like glycosyltransferase
MLATGRWIEPIVNFEPYHHKPSLFYVLVGLGYRAFGVTELGARFVPAVGAWLTILLTFAYGARRDVAEGLLAALLLGSCAFFVGVGRFTNFDAPLTFFLTAAALSAARLIENPSERPWAYTFHACVALAVLTKGPVALVLAGVPVGLALWRGDLEPEDLVWRRGGALAAAIVSCWAVPVLVVAPRYLADFLWVHNVERYLAGADADVFHPEPFWFYVPVVVLGLLPWSPLLPRVAGAIFAPPRNRDPQRFLAEFAVVVVAFFSLSSGKLATYVLPAFPALAILTAHALRTDAHEEPWAGRTAATVGAAGCASLVVVAFFALQRAAPGLERIAWVALPVSAAGALVVATGRRFTTSSAVVTCATGMCLTLFLLNAFGANAASRYTSDRDLAFAAMNTRAPGQVIAYRVRPFSFQFYTGWRLGYHQPLDEVRSALYSPVRTLVLTEERWAAHLEDLAPGVTLREVARNPRHVLYRVEGRART